MSQARIAPREAWELLTTLWAPLDHGFIEWRPLAPRPTAKDRRAQARGRRWMALPDALDRLPAFLAWCADHDFSAYFGVLPRLTYGRGTTDNIGRGAVAWVDIDLPIAECSERCALVPYTPSAVVATGRGVHAYWLLSEASEPAECAALSAGLSRVVGGDSTSDAARLLRLPGSVNPKHRWRPQARLIHLDAGRRYCAVELGDWLGEVTPSPVRPTVQRPSPIRLQPEQLGLALMRRTRFARAVVERRLQSVAGAEVGERNSRLYAAARTVGQLTCGAPFDDVEALARLVDAGIGTGLSREEAEEAASNGVTKGRSDGWTFDA